MNINGTCHCGNLGFELATGKSWDDITLRVCHCTFCLRHRGRYWSDPDGTIDIRVQDEGKLIRYRFGHGTADFCICGTCGVFGFAVADAGDGHRAVANLNLALDQHTRVRETVLEALDEDESARNTRRTRNWTPVASPWPPSKVV